MIQSNYPSASTARGETLRRGLCCACFQRGLSVGLLAEAQEPIQTVLVLALVLHTLPGHAATAGGGHNDIVSGPPVGRSGAGVGIRFLECQNDALDLIKVAARGQRIIQDGPHHAVGVNDKHRPHCLCVGLSRLDHPVLVGHFHADMKKAYEMGVRG